MATASSHQYANIARPYAQAAFDYARDQKQLLEWKAFLATLATIVEQPEVCDLLSNPNISPEKWYNLIASIVPSPLDTSRKNFLHLLTENKRLMALPSMADIFNDYYEALEKITTVRVITAIEVTDEYRRRLVQSLSKRIHHDVTLACEVDPSIIGGAIFHLGDIVIDGSVRGKLHRLLESTLG